MIMVPHGTIIALKTKENYIYLTFNQISSLFQEHVFKKQCYVSL